MQTIGSIVRRHDIEPDLGEYLKNISPEKLLNFTTIRENIENGSGRFTEVEEFLLLLEGVFKRFKGESGW